MAAGPMFRIGSHGTKAEVMDMKLGLGQQCTHCPTVDWFCCAPDVVAGRRW